MSDSEVSENPPLAIKVDEAHQFIALWLFAVGLHNRRHFGEGDNFDLVFFSGGLIEVSCGEGVRSHYHFPLSFDTLIIARFTRSVNIFRMVFRP